MQKRILTVVLLMAVMAVGCGGQEKKEQEKEKKLQQAVLDIKKKYGKNAVLKGMNFEEGATTRERNGQIGGHKA